MMRSTMQQNGKTLMGAALFTAAIAASPSLLAQSGICQLTGNPPVPATAPCNVPPPSPGLNIPDPGLINPDTWGFGPANDLTPEQQNAPYWNPVKARIVAGLPVIGKRVSTAGIGAGSAFCNVAEYDMASNHFTWIDMLHSGLGYSQVWPMMVNSLIMAVVIAVGKIAVSIISAYAIVYFRFPFRTAFFWMIFVTLMLPVEVRIIPTFKVVSDLGMINSYVGLTLPLIASATATFLFRQFFLTAPDELAEAARIDGAGPMRFFWDVVVPMSKTSMAALFVIQFIYGWNQYLWPLIVTTREDYYTVVIGIKRMIASGDAAVDWNLVMATAMLALIPPAIVVVLMQRWFVKGLVDTEK